MGAKQPRYGRESSGRLKRLADRRLIPRRAQRGKTGQILAGHGDTVKRQSKSDQHIQPEVGRNERECGMGWGKGRQGYTTRPKGQDQPRTKGR